MNYPIGLTCEELVELVTEYLDNSLAADVCARFELHLGVCPGCVEYLDQLRHTIRATGQLRAEALDPHVRDALLNAFRTWHVTQQDAAGTEPT